MDFVSNGEPGKDWSDVFSTSSVAAVFCTSCKRATATLFKQVNNELQSDWRIEGVDKYLLYVVVEHWFDFGNISDL